jgi:hypothetical protein
VAGSPGHMKLKYYLDDMFTVEGLQAYLNCSEFSKEIMAVARFRTGGHTLRIETGRWQDLPRESRLCECCGLGQPESEQHFLFDCPYYCIIRGHFHLLFDSTLAARDLKFFWTTHEENMPLVAKYMHACFAARKSLLESRTRSAEPLVAPYQVQ